MPAEVQNVSGSTPSMRHVPRAIWVGGGLLAMATAGLAGALVMRSVEPAPSSAVAQPAAAAMPAAVALPSSAATAVNTAAQPVPASTHAATKLVHTAAKPTASTTASTATSTTNTAHADHSLPERPAPAVICASCGTVESVSAVQQKGQGTGLGAVAGGVLGGVLGHQVGGGHGKTAMTVLGAVGGGMAGNEVEKRARSETLFSVKVRMDDGSVRSFQQSQSLAVGTQVVAEGSALRVAHPGT